MLRKLGLVKYGLFATAPLLSLVLAGEVVCRLKYFLFHDHDWNYLTMPFKVADTVQTSHAAFMPPAAESQVASGQAVVKRHRPCRNHDVFSAHYQRVMPYTYDGFCFRGDRIAMAKPHDEFRVFVLGGSAVEDVEPDGDTTVDYIKRSLPPSYADHRVMVVNAGNAGYGSASILDLYARKVWRFAPDLVVYLEAWNEQVDYSRWMQVDQQIGRMQGTLHRALHYRSMLYTYIEEKIQFSTTEAVRFWKIDVGRLADNFVSLADSVAKSGAKFVLVTQPAQFARYHRGIDTFDFDQTNGLLDSLQRDSSYTYDAFEISALNQRLAVALQVQLATRHAIPIVDILPEIEGLGPEKRKEIFTDLGHLTWIGNQMVGELIGSRLHLTNP